LRHGVDGSWPDLQDKDKHTQRLDVMSAAGGYVFRPNFNHAAEVVLRDFRAGLLGQFNLDIDLLKNEDVHSPAVGVEAW